MSEPFGGPRNRLDILDDLQRRALSVFRDQSVLSQTSGVTRIPLPPASGDTALANLNNEVIRSYQAEGPRLFDRRTTNPSETYRNRRYEFIRGFEGIRRYAYDDATGRRVNGSASGNITVGIGFNMDRSGARDTWLQVFGPNGPAFDEVYTGQRALTDNQVQTLFDNDILNFERIVDRAAGDRVLTENQRMALVSIAYGSPGRVTRWSPLIQSGNWEALINEVLYNGFRQGHWASRPLANRRYMEAALFSGMTDAHNYLPDHTEYMRRWQ